LGSPAARLGDPTVHGGTIVAGLPTVLIGGQPASRIGDMHACPMVTVVVPHVGGPLVLGSFTVLTGGVPQSRVGDMLICVGPPDAVAMGCSTVLVGMVGGGLGFGAILSGLMAGFESFAKGPSSTPTSSADNPPYEPGRWNRQPVRGSTNCYAYAANDPDGHPAGKPQPGEHCGNPATDESCSEVSRAAICDGMIAAPDPPLPRPGYYPVALVVDPGADYHWYRLDSNGGWSHKPGNTSATNIDASGNPITDPKTADRNYGAFNYSKFCGYFYVPTPGIRTGPP
jgi:uncharacterized Zn-binding protein involved in type VI secretion